MKATELLLLGLVGWTAIGVVGVGVSLWRGERETGAAGGGVAGGSLGSVSVRAGWGFAGAAAEGGRDGRAAVLR